MWQTRPNDMQVQLSWQYFGRFNTLSVDLCVWCSVREREEARRAGPLATAGTCIR